MNVSVETLPNCLATLRVEVGSDHISPAREHLIRDFMKDARIPGFRPGKTPRALVEKRFQKQIHEELESKVLNDALSQAIRDKGINVIRVRNVDDVEFTQDRLSFLATLITLPEFQLPEYKGLPVKVSSGLVADSEVDTVLESLRERSADFTPLEEQRGAVMDDFVIVDYVGTIDGKPVHELFPKLGPVISKNEDFWLRMTPESFFPGFCSHLEGARPGDVRNFQIEVPADFPLEGVAGQKIDYTVTLKEIRVRTLPDLNDELASEYAPGKTLVELRELVHADLSRRKLAEVQNSKSEQVMEQLLAKVECELPEDMTRSGTNEVLEEVLQENKKRGVSLEMLRENEKELIASASQTARNRLKGSFILGRIAQQEQIQVTREDLLGRIAALAKGAEMTVEKAIKEVQKRRMLPQIESELVAGKALDFVVANATVTIEENL
jgi:trigger factor